MGDSELQPVAVVGAGAWGTALAAHLAGAGIETLLWAREPEVVEAITDRQENTRFLPGVPLAPSVRATGDLREAAAASLILWVTPAQHMRAILREARPALKEGAVLVSCAKGIEAASGAFMSEIAAEIAPAARFAVLSGPSFAADVARGLPTAVTLAAADPALGEALLAVIGRGALRPYLSSDTRGAELGGAVKNVLAIACGIAAGRGLGDSARAALITRGFAEMTRFGLALGARAETLAGLSGLGDLVLTCSSRQSRNFALGETLGTGTPREAALKDGAKLAEGAATAPALVRRARAVGVEMPIAEAVAAILAGTAEIDAAIAALLSRPLKMEA
ncbi:MAG: NAD(P)H-dependent glycerol-3-phosphate dehydrogenase [Alphaproteobacteria bacterium]|nr:NAD(P)H-dependent glycerol-3-phosphate dehydrogenase [Alphaproteobacteria bacterium]